MQHEGLVFWDNLKKLKKILFLSDVQFSNKLGLTLNEYQKVSFSLTYPSIDKIYSFAEQYNFHAFDLFKIDFDFAQLISNLYRFDSFPAKYSYATYSKTKSIINILNYLEKTRGIQAKINVLRHFQVGEELLYDPSQSTNIFLITDIINYAQQIYQLTSDEFFRMGQFTPFQSAGFFIKDKLNGLKSIEENIECFFSDCTHIFDKNCSYKIESLSNGKAIIAAIPSKDVLEELRVGINSFGNSSVCATRMGVISSVTVFNFEHYASLKRLPSGNDESMASKYLLEFDHLKKLGSFSRPTSNLKSIYH